MSYLDTAKVASVEDTIEEIGDLGDLDERHGPGRKPSVPKLARLALLAEFSRRIENDELFPGEKKQAVVRMAIEWAKANLDLNLKETATRAALLPILERLSPK